jgi:transposase
MHYSVDLRERVLNAVDKGTLRAVVSSQFAIDVKTIYLWLRQRKERGHIRPITGYQKGHSHKITNLSRFREFVDFNRGMTQRTLADKWGSISCSSICRSLKKIGYTRKKRLMDIKSVTKKKERYI